jgi:ATP-binding cassette subfamily B protein/subfamily B ATP-binding cassette protein MsbA
VNADAGRYLRILAYAVREWPVLAGILALALAWSSLAALQPWPLKILVDSAIGGQPLPAPVAAWFAGAGIEPGSAALIALAGAASMVLFVALFALDAGLVMGWSVAGQRVVYRLATAIFARLQRLSLRFHAGQPVGDSIERITTDSWCVYAVADNLLVVPARHLTLFATTGAIAWQLDPGLALLMLVAVPALAASAVFFRQRLKQRALLSREARSRLTAFVQQVLGAVPMVQAFGLAPRNRQVFAGHALDVVGAARRSSLAASSFNAVNGMATALALALVVFVGGLHVQRGELSLGSLLVFIAYARSLQSASLGLLTAFAKLRAADASVDRVLETLGSDAAVVERPDARPLPARRGAGGARQQFRAVRFGYEPGEPVLDGIDLDIAPGETVALVGATGAGKSTLAALVARFHDPWSGAVLIDGIDLRDLQLSSLRREIALVLQEPFILPLSVAGNIAYGRPQATRDEVIAAATDANAHEFIRLLPAGYDTLLGEQGADLSGGQRQRIAIARAFLRNARVLIMDEPTSALDAGSEQRVMEAATRLRAGRTTLVIAHRPSTIRAADRIALLAQGRIAEIGTEAQLRARRGLYAQLFAQEPVPRYRESP